MKMKIRSIKEKEEEFRRNEILKVALGVFSEKGYHSTKMSDIAKFCGMSVGSLYNIFQNKEELYISLFEAKVQEVFDEVEKAASSFKEPFESLKGMTMAYFNAGIKYGEFFRLFMNETIGFKRERKERWKERIFSTFMKHLEAVKSIVKKFAGTKDDEEALILTLIYLGMVHQLIVFHLRINKEIDPEKLTGIILRVLNKGIKKEER